MNKLIESVVKHINSKHSIPKGDKQKWSEWFDKLEMFANLLDAELEKQNAKT